MNPREFALGLANSLPALALWVLAVCALCIAMLRLIAGWVRDRPGKRSPASSVHSTAGPLETLRHQILDARFSPLRREQVMRQLRDLTQDVISLHDGIPEETASRAIRNGTWTRDRVLLRMMGRSLQNEWLLPRRREQGERFATDVAEYLERLRGYSRGTGAGETGGRS